MIGCDKCGQFTDERALSYEDGLFLCQPCSYHGDDDLQDIITGDGEHVIWLAFYESSNFSFFATGPTSYTAHSALVDGLKRHGEGFGCEPNWWYEEDIYLTPSHIGQCLRDREPIKREGN